MTFFFHRAAEKDLTDALRFYKAEAGKGVAGKFLKEFERVVAVLEEFPGIGTPQGGERLSFPLTRFPYSVIYRMVDTGIRILVVRHQSRDPIYGDERS
jgi:plasmid stabilization system protein ParE